VEKSSYFRIRMPAGHRAPLLGKILATSMMYAARQWLKPIR